MCREGACWIAKDGIKAKVARPLAAGKQGRSSRLHAVNYILCPRNLVDEAQITSSPHLHSFRYPIFQPSQRKAIDADLRSLIKDRDGKLTTGDISVGRK